MRATSPAATRNITAVTTNIVSTLVVATTRPPMAGPMRKARLSIVLDAPFAAVSSPGCDVSEGSQASWAGRNTHPTSGTIVASTSTTQAGASTTSATTAATTRPDRTRVDTSSTALRDRRSTTEAPSGVRDRDEGQPHAGPEPDELGAALAVGPHGHGGRVGPVAHEGGREGELHPAQRGLAEDRAQRPPGRRRALRDRTGACAGTSVSTATATPPTARHPSEHDPRSREGASMARSSH